MTHFHDGKKRLESYMDENASSMGFTSHSSPKRPRLVNFWTNDLSNTLPRGRGRTQYIQLPGQLATPPMSAESTKSRTVPLKLKIPERMPEGNEKRQMAARKAAAKRWEKSGKLQRSEPEQKEIKAAYNLKLLRHYPAPTTELSTSAAMPSSSTPQDNVVKPVIQKSARVTNLLHSFPSLAVPTQNLETSYYDPLVKSDLRNLAWNKMITATDYAKKLAWRSFAKPDQPHREVMVESALTTDDLQMEYKGLPNQLPEWKKFNTSEYVAEKNGKLGGKNRSMR